MDHSKFKKITTLMFDVDGVFTNCFVEVQEDGSLLRKMNVRDGQALKLAKNAGYRLVAFTKGASKGARIRLKSLGIQDYFDQLEDKLPTFKQYIEKHNLSKEEMLYMGDDIPDLALFPYVGISCCPNDACNDVLIRAEYVSPVGGGQGWVREIVERVMRIQDKWPV